ncbi:MAG: FtsB family cell division protein [Tissierella sp.]|uniref:FtsB family cell division protein n=1 Tax=Tissierella sp. TaxID=41274 RepID=UPI003F9CA2E1
MNNKNKKNRKNKQKFRIKLRHIVTLFVFIYIISIVINQNKLKKELTLKEEAIENDIENLQEDIGDLNEEIEKRGTIEFLENTAREELGMVKPNEIIYIDKGKFKNSIFNFFDKYND